VATITFDHITKRYADGFEAVKDMSLTVADGEFMILVGPSGSGKSTALRMVAGLENITEGELRIGDEVVNDRAPKDRDIAMVFQDYALYPHMTVRQNMGFALKLARAPKEEIDRRTWSSGASTDAGHGIRRLKTCLTTPSGMRPPAGCALPPRLERCAVSSCTGPTLSCVA